MKKSLFRAKRAPTKARPKKPSNQTEKINMPIEPVNAPLYPPIEDRADEYGPMVYNDQTQPTVYPSASVSKQPFPPAPKRARPMPPITKWPS